MKIIRITILAIILNLSGIFLNNIYAQSTVPERVNMGLYGGAAGDLTFSNLTHRLFAGIETPASIFYTDDSCKTWIRAFQTDSLEFAGGQRGWGGGGREIHCNNDGWVLALTQQHGGNLSAAVLSKTDGDSGTFFTLLDQFMLHDVVPSAMGPSSATAIALNDHSAFVAMRNYIIRYDGSAYFNLLDITTVSPLSASSSVLDLAVVQDSTNLPLYFIATNSFDGNNGLLFKTTSTSSSQLTLPFPSLKAMRVFTHPNQASGDTVIISCIDTVTNQLKAYRSLNGGITWTDITPAAMGQFPLSDVDYSPDWVSSMPISGGIRIILPGSAYSDDLGTTWNTYSLVNNSNATHPLNPLFVVGSRGRGPVISTNGNAGPWVLQDNYGLSAVRAGKISSSKGVYYLSTNAGLAYTNAYFDTTVAFIDKWNPPYGQFPVPNVGDDAGISSVAIDPNDSLHVVAGYSWGFSVSTTGPAGFTNISPLGWNSTTQYDQSVTDIKFLNSDTIIATTGSKLNVQQMPGPTGNIWKSTDGGASWAKITPTGMVQPNCVAVNTVLSNTVIYVGTGHFQQGASTIPGELWKSTDVGTTWTRVNYGPNSIMGGDTAMPILDIVIDKFSLDTLYIASGQNLGHAMVISKDGGLSYIYTPVSGEGAFTSLMKYSPSLIFVANRREILGYSLSTGFYGLISRSLPGEFIPDLEKGSLLAATNTGLYRINLKDTLTLYINDKFYKANSLNAIITPNPFTDNITIEIDGEQAKHIEIRIYDLSGREIFVQSLSNPQNTIDVSTSFLSRGVYIIHLQSGATIFQSKLIKQ